MTPAEYTKSVDRWSDDIFRFAMRCCNVREHCEDAVQEAFATLWERIDKIKANEAKSFLFTVTQRRLFDMIRHEKVVQKGCSEMALTQDDIDEPLEQIDLKEAMNKALQQLPERQRAILQLHDVEGYRYEEIATIMNMNYKQVQVDTFRAKVKMKQLLKSYGIER